MRKVFSLKITYSDRKVAYTSFCGAKEALYSYIDSIRRDDNVMSVEVISEEEVK